VKIEYLSYTAKEKGNKMKVSLFSQSLFAFDLSKAIATTAEIGFPAIELACTDPHFDLKTARKEPERIADEVQQAGLTVSALSLFNTFTDPAGFDEQVETAVAYIRLAPLFKTRLLKLTPGSPSSAEATEEHWQCFANALNRLIPIAREVGVRLAFETHMGQLTDTLTSSQRLMEMTPADVVGMTVDFLNLAFAGEKMTEMIPVLRDRMVHTHIKNGHIDSKGGWHFQALDRGLIDYVMLLRLLRDVGYTGYLSIECLSPQAAEMPSETARRDFEILNSYLDQVGYSGSG
jgi:sugar phosphate isomerase/epimerase